MKKTAAALLAALGMLLACSAPSAADEEPPARRLDLYGTDKVLVFCDGDDKIVVVTKHLSVAVTAIQDGCKN